ncbi:AAA family ATPase [Synechococcus sp. AH-601-C19]|nr:AAA family ATPase [Synechococcus sp. AH-601-C19]
MKSAAKDALFALQRGLLAALLRRIPPEQSSEPLVELVHALTLALSRGDISLQLHDEAEAPEGIESKGWPKLHREALVASGWLDGDQSVLVLSHNTLSWRRWHGAMQELERELQRRCFQAPIHATPHSATSSQLAKNNDLSPEQRSAVRAIDHYGVVLLSGGPGTGKTSTVLHMLLRALEHQPKLRARLAAPTGKAARRLQDAIRSHPKTASLPCTTLHRLLEARPGGFGRHRRNPLHVDLLIVDEMSMVDLELGRALLSALPPHCQLVLVGDSAQLPPIGAGAVWQHLQEPDQIRRFNDGAITLTKVYRNRGALAQMSALLRDQGLRPFWSQLSALPKTSNISVACPKTKQIPEAVHAALIQHLDHLKERASALEINAHGQPHQQQAQDLLNILDGLMVLCPRRRGPWGVDAVHQRLLDGAEPQRWPSGLPVLCSENQPELGLANGDLGVMVGEGAHQRALFLSSAPSGESRHALLHPARLRHLEPALALTIHKAQGCEMDKVLLLWPALDDRQSSSLLYTAITRAKQQLLLFADPIAMVLSRTTGSRHPEDQSKIGNG